MADPICLLGDTSYPYIVILSDAGCGHGLPIVARVLILEDYFKTKFTLANGISFTGGAIGMIVFAPLMEFLIEIYGWRGAMFILAALNLNICVAGMLMTQPDHNMQLLRDEPIDVTFQQSLKQLGTAIARMTSFSTVTTCPILTVYLSAILLHEAVVGGWILFLVSYTITLNYSVQTASFLSAVGGAGALMGRLTLGPFIDAGLITGRMMFFCLAAGGTLTMCSYPFTGDYWLLTLISFMTGFFITSAAPVFVVMIKEITDDKAADFAGAIGLHYVARGAGSLIGGPITGRLT